MSQIINITSEALQATVRRLLPSQQGFGEDLQATNVVTPIIDLTPTAEGSVLPTYLQTAVNFGGATTVAADGTTDTFITSPGFYRLIGSASVIPSSGTDRSVSITCNDGSTTKTVWELTVNATGIASVFAEVVDLTFFARAGDSFAVTADTAAKFGGSVRQVADVKGNLVQPVGFTFE